MYSNELLLLQLTNAVVEGRGREQTSIDCHISHAQNQMVRLLNVYRFLLAIFSPESLSALFS